MKIAYISGPISANDRLEMKSNIEKAASLAERVRQLGYAVICPHESAEFYPDSLSHDEWLEIDLKLLSVCDICVLVEPEYEKFSKSTGTMIEVGFCLENEIPIYKYTKTDDFKGIEKIEIPTK